MSPDRKAAVPEGEEVVNQEVVVEFCTSAPAYTQDQETQSLTPDRAAPLASLTYTVAAQQAAGGCGRGSRQQHNTRHQ